MLFLLMEIRIIQVKWILLYYKKTDVISVFFYNTIRPKFFDLGLSKIKGDVCGNQFFY